MGMEVVLLGKLYSPICDWWARQRAHVPLRQINTRQQRQDCGGALPMNIPDKQMPLYAAIDTISPSVWLDQQWHSPRGALVFCGATVILTSLARALSSSITPVLSSSFLPFSHLPRLELVPFPLRSITAAAPWNLPHYHRIFSIYPCALGSLIPSLTSPSSSL